MAPYEGSPVMSFQIVPLVNSFSLLVMGEVAIPHEDGACLVFSYRSLALPDFEASQEREEFKEEMAAHLHPLDVIEVMGLLEKVDAMTEYFWWTCEKPPCHTFFQVVIFPFKENSTEEKLLILKEEMEAALQKMEEEEEAP